MKSTFNALFETPLGQAGLAVLQRLDAAGYPAYFVGGCVRDTLLGRELKDIDIATSAEPAVVLELYPDAIPTGLSHGTVTVRADEHLFEVTTFRTESEYGDGRRPDNVTFIESIEGDLARRDFTMNAMALSAQGELVDPYDGRRDLSQGLLRCVRDPALRFGEDALRMLRCVRFAAEYSLQIDPPTWQEVLAGAPGLSRIAMERVRMEMERMIAGAEPYRALCLLKESGLLRWTKARLRLPRDLGIIEADDPLMKLHDITEPLQRWVLWFLRMGLNSSETASVVEALRGSRDFADRTGKLIAIHRALAAAPAAYAERAWKTAVIDFGRETATGWLSIAYVVQGDRDYRWIALYTGNAEHWLDELTVASLGELAVNGRDLMQALRKKGGPWLSHLLHRLLIETALQKLPNDREALLTRALHIFSEEGDPKN